MGRPSKKELERKRDAVRLKEKDRIEKLLKDAELFAPSLTPVIENYLDAFVIYRRMYEDWRDEGFPATKVHINKAGAENEMKHPLSQQVETWHEKMNKMFKLLGVTNDGKIVLKPDGNDNKTSENTPGDELAVLRNKWRDAK